MTASSSDAVTASEAMIIKHIEYFFGDFKLSRNHFLKGKRQEDDGWVTIDTILKFNRLKKITDNAQMICEALKKSSSGLIEVSEQGDKIRRSPSKPLPDDTKETREEINARTVCAKPFPLDAKVDDLRDFFENYGQVDNMSRKRMGKMFRKKTFEGSVFVTFANKEDAAKFVSEENTKFKGKALEEKRFKNEYFKEKEAQEKAKDKNDTEGKQHKKVEDETKEEETEAVLEERVSQMMTKNAVLHLKDLNSKTIKYDEGIKHEEVPMLNYASCDGEEQETGEPSDKVIKSEKVITRPQSKRKQSKNNASSDGDEQDTEEPPAKVIMIEMAITLQQVIKFESASSDREEQDTEEPPAKITKCLVKIARPQSKTKQTRKVDSGGEEQDTEEPPAKITKCVMKIARSQSKTKQNRKVDSGGEEQDTK